MTDAVVSLLVDNIWQLVSENVNLTRGAKVELDNLLRDVNSLKAFLKDDSRLKSDSSSWNDLVKNIRIQAYKDENVIEKFVVEAKLHEGKNLFKRIIYYGGHVKRVNNFAKEIKHSSESVKNLHQRICKDIKRNLSLPNRVARKPQDRFLEDNQIVGFSKEANEVIEWLIGGTEEVEFIPILGMNGLGKTTLAIKVWRDSQITIEFSKNIWVSVGQSDELKDAFFVILKSSTEPNQEFQYNGVNELAKVIPKFVTEQHRCLIVLDDVWATELVDFFKNLLPENKKGHRILMTTRFRDVASYASENTYHLKFLNQEDSFLLLENRAVHNRKCPDEFRRLGKSIASKCGGLPLALVVISRALKVNKSVYDWNRIKDNFLQYLVEENDPNTCWKIVEASYGTLSSEMKVCFLYCLAFSKGYDIPVQMLIRLWIAEGLIESSPLNSFEEKAENYLMEFENLNLVIVSRDITCSIKRVKCNDLFYEFYKMEVIKERVFHELHLTPDLPSIEDADISRRLHIESCDLSDFISKVPRAEHVRSFLCFSSEDQQTESSSDVDIQLIPKAFPLLRVLKIESVNIPSLKNFNRLYHLRYISISGDFKELPAFFSEFLSLQSIIIYTSKPTINIKANIWNMSKLMHLQTNNPAKLPLPSTKKGKRSSSLQTLNKILPESFNKVVLGFGNAWKNLKKLSIQGQIQDSFQLPTAMHIFLLNLKKLTLSNTMLDWKEATKLGQLECLEVLKLKNDAFTGKSWMPEVGQFQKLQVLLIHSSDLHVWKASGYHFPELRVLVLKCPKLETVPDELSQFLQSG